MSHPPATSDTNPQHHHHHHHHHDDHYSAASLRRSYRSFASSFIVAARAAEKYSVANTNSAANTAVTGENAAAPSPNQTPAQEKAAKDAKTVFESSVQILLKQKATIRRTATTLENKLRGGGKETEALNCLLKSAPCVGGRGRKRKFDS